MADFLTLVGIPLVCLAGGYVLGATNGRAERLAREGATASLQFANWLCNKNGVDFKSMLEAYANDQQKSED